MSDQRGPKEDNKTGYGMLRLSLGGAAIFISLQRLFCPT